MEFMREFIGTGGRRIRVVASHFRAKSGVRSPGDLARRGTAVEVITDPTRRRASSRAAAALSAAGVTARRRQGVDGYVPRRLRFVLLESRERRCAGGFNWTNPSSHLNHEIALVAEDPARFQSLGERRQALDRRISSGGRHA